jgi:hypothetical protein
MAEGHIVSAEEHQLEAVQELLAASPEHCEAEAGENWRRGGMAVMRELARSEVGVSKLWRLTDKVKKDQLEKKREQAEQERARWEREKTAHQEEWRKKQEATKPPKLQFGGRRGVQEYAKKKQGLLAAKLARQQAGRGVLRGHVYVPPSESATVSHDQHDWYAADPATIRAVEVQAELNRRPVGFGARTRGLERGGMDSFHYGCPVDEGYIYDEWGHGYHAGDRGQNATPQRGSPSRLAPLAGASPSPDGAGRRKKAGRRRQSNLGELDPAHRRLSPAGTADGADAPYAASVRQQPPVHLAPPAIPVHHTRKTAAAEAISTAMNGPAAIRRHDPRLAAQLPGVGMVLPNENGVGMLEHQWPVRENAPAQASRPSGGSGGERDSQASAVQASVPLGGGGWQGVQAVAQWRVSDVAHWLRTECCMPSVVPAFVEQGVDGGVLVELYHQLTTDPAGECLACTPTALGSADR